MPSARILLAILVGAAAFLRLGGLDQGVRRGSAAGDEQHNFIEPIREMASRPTLDPGVRPGYPGLFNHLAFVPVVVGDRVSGERGAYVGARGLGAVFSIANVLLVFLLGRALAGEWTGLFAAAMITLSRGEVVHAHFVTPDLAVISGLLLVLLILSRPPLGTRAVALAGLTCGLTVAVKYTGLVVIPAALVALLASRAPARRFAAFAAAALCAFALGAPYALLGRSPESGMGLSAAVRDYYSPTGYAAMTAKSEGYAGPGMALELAGGYLRQNLGLAGLVLAAAAVVAYRPRRALAPVLAGLVAALAATLPARIVFPRHVLVPSALLTVLAACGLQAVHDRLSAAGDGARRAVASALAAIALLALAPPTVAVASGFRRPDSLDLAAAWIEKNVPGQPLVATAYPRFAVEDRFEVRHWSPPAEVPLADLPPEVLRHYDLVAAPASFFEGVAEQGRPWRAVSTFGKGPDAAALAFPEPPSAEAVVPSGVEASEAPADAAGPWTGASPWRCTRPDGWILGEWDRRRHIVRVDLVSDGARGFTPQRMVLEGRAPDGRWRRLRAWALRPRTLSQQDPRAPHGQVLVLAPPMELTGLRIFGRGSAPWGLARISVFAEPEDGRPGTMLRVPWTAGR